MIQVFTIFFVLAVFPAGFVLSEEKSDCCMSKTVGDHAYTLIENNASAITMGCNSPCVYQRDEDPGTRFCFKTGGEPVTCMDDMDFIRNVKIQNNLVGAVYVTVIITRAQSINVVVNGNSDGTVRIPPGSTITLIEVAYAVGGQTMCQSIVNPANSLFVINLNVLLPPLCVIS